jgi:hypothetical protein
MGFEPSRLNGRERSTAKEVWTGVMVSWALPTIPVVHATSRFTNCKDSNCSWALATLVLARKLAVYPELADGTSSQFFISAILRW